MSAATINTTLHEYLTQANPTLLKAEPRNFSGTTPTPSTTKNRKYPRIKKLKPWSEFTGDTVRSIFDGRLQYHLERQIDDLRDFSNLHSTFRMVYCESDLDRLISKWHQSVVLEALDKTSTDIVSQSVQMVNGRQALLVFDESNGFAPDWAGINDVERLDQLSQFNNLLPGDTKTSWNFKSENLYDSRKSSQDPLRQLLHYCVLSCSRYGYLITDQELVIIRVGCKKSDPKANLDPFKCQKEVERNAVIEYHSIPWTASGLSSSMTINLALWVLHILAANNGRLQTVPYKLLSLEKVIPRSEQVALPKAVRSDDDPGQSAKGSPGEQSYRPDDSDEEPVAPRFGGSDTEDDTREYHTDAEDTPSYSNTSSFALPTPMRYPKRKRQAHSDVDLKKTIQSEVKFKSTKQSAERDRSRRRGDGLRPKRKDKGQRSRRPST